MTDQFDANYFSGLAAQPKADIAQDARRTLIASSDTNPDQAAEASKLSRQYNVPQQAVEQDLDFYRKENKFPSEYFTKLSQSSPDLASFIANQDNAKIIHDDVGALLYTADKMRSFGGAAVQFGSDVIGGTGDTAISLGQTMLQQNSMQQIVGLNLLSAGRLLDFSSEEGLDKAADTIRPPEERRDFGDDVIEGLSQVASQIVLFSRNPAAATGALFATGAEQQSDRLDANNVNDPSTRLLAQTAGGLVTGATERVQLGVLMNRVPGLSKIMGKAPKALQKKWAETALDIGGAAGAEAAQEVIEGALQDLIAYGIYNPDQEFFETIQQEAATAGVVGGIARTAILAITGGRRASEFQNQANEADKLKDAATQAKQAGESTNLLARDPEKLKEFLATANEGAEVTLDSSVIEELYQSGNDIEKFFESVPEARAAFEDAELTGADVKLPADKLVFAMAEQSENGLDFIADFIKQEDGLSSNQVADPEFINEQIEDIMRQAQEVQASFENDQQQQEFYERVEQQVADNLMDGNRLGEKARTPDAARQEAVLYGSFAKALIERGGEGAKQVLENVFGGNFKVKGPQPAPPSLPITGEDAYIDSLRKKQIKASTPAKASPVKDLLGKVKPKREKATPKPLIDLLSKSGKVQRGSPAAAELEAIGVSPKSYPRIFSKDGSVRDLDQFVADEVETRLGVSGVFARDEDLNGYIDRAQLLDFIREETFGNYIQTDEEVAQSQQDDYDDQIIDELQRRGVDVETASNDDVKRALQQASDEYASGEQLYQNGNIATDSEAFKNWFGDSKVVDEDGAPLVVYHGGFEASNITEFSKDFGGQTTGNNEAGVFHFADNFEVAEDYARQSFNRRFQDDPESLVDEGYIDELPDFDGDYEAQYAFVEELADKQASKDVQSVYLKAENVIEVDMEGERVDVQMIEDLTQAAIRGYDETGEYDQYFENFQPKYDDSDINDYKDEIEERARENHDLEADEQIEEYQFEEATQEILDENYIEPELTKIDGIVIRNMVDDIGEASRQIADQFIVFEPNQIKSVKNTGTFDSNDDRILFQSENRSVEDLQQDLIEKHDLKTLFLTEKRGNIAVDSIIIDKDKRSQGIGSAVMQEIVDYADRVGKRVVLTPAVRDDFQGTTSQARLKKFYKRFGFVENKGRNKDYAISESMIREPQLYQDKDTKRGSIQLGDQGQRVINLFEGADESTFFHETGHLFLDLFSQIAVDPNATEEIKADYEAALKWMGVESADQIGVDQHEQWARGFEAYLYEGKGPSENLRGVFDRFKIWLINVYKNIKALDVNLDDNIRGVFDRLLATDAEIDALKNNTLFRPNEQTLEMLNATERAKYIKQQERAISEAKNKLFRKALRQKRRENTQWYNEQRDIIRTDEEALLQGSSLYRAMQVVTTGKDFNGEAVFEGETKFSEKDITELYGNKEILKYLPRGSRTKGAGIDIKMMAEMFGFTNAKDMVDTMINADPYKLRLQKNIDQEMIRRHGDMLNDGTIEREALEAVMTESPELNFVELDALSRQTGTQYPTNGDFKTAAKRAIADQKVDHSIKPDKYYRAALKAERDYGKLLAKDDFEGAADAKRRVILNKYMFKEARDARTEVDKTLKKFQKLSKIPAKKKKPVIDPEYHGKIWDALGAYQLGPRLTESKKLKLELSAINDWIIQKEQDEFAQLVMPPQILEAQEKDHYRDLTLNEFRGLSDLITNLETQGRRKLQYIADGERRELAELIDELNTTAAINNSERAKPLSKRETEKLSAKIGDIVGAIDAVNTKAQTIFLQLDGGEYGAWSRTFFEPIQRAEVQKNIRSRAEMQNMQDIIDKHYGKDFRRKKLRMKMDKAGDIVDVETYVQTFMNEEFAVTNGNIEENLSREMILSIAQHQGTADNKLKLLEGYEKTKGWDQAFIDDALSNMTKRDWEFVQDTWDYLDSFWPEVSKIEQAEFGYAPEKIEHEPLTVQTSDGQTVDLRGGYMRIIYDRNQDVQSEKEAIADVQKDMMVGAAAKAQTRNGSTNERKNNVTRPIRLDLDVLSEHINEQVTYITMHDAVKNANQVLRKQKIQESLQTYIGNEGRLMIETWLQDTASAGVMAGGVINRGFRSLRGNYTLGRLGLRPLTALLQFSGLAQTAGDVGTKNMLAGLQKVFSRGNPYTMSQEIKAKSPYMKEREFTLTRDVADALRTLTRPDAGKVSQYASLMLYPMQKMQEVVDSVTWAANYQKALKDGFDDGDAIRQADIAVSRTQGSGLVSDLAAIERGTLNEQTQRQEFVKLATMFFSYFNAKYNVAKTKNIQYKNNQIGLDDLALSYLMTFAIEGLISALLMGQLDFDKDDDENISGGEIASTIGLLTLQQTAATLPFVRDIAGAASGFNSQGAAQAQLQGIGSFVGTLTKTATQLSEGDDVNWYSFTRGALNTTNAVLPIPAGAMNQILRAAEKESKGEEPTIIDYMVYRD